MKALPETKKWDRKRACLSFSLLLFIFGLSLVVVNDDFGTDESLSHSNKDSKIDEGDTTFMIISSAMVMLMTPGLSFFYGGMVRRTSLISTLLQSFVIMGLVLFLWVLIGFSLSFGEVMENFQFVGNPASYFLLRNVPLDPDELMADSIPFKLFALFQATFAMLTPAMITGAVAERTNFYALMLFVAVWHVLVYCPLAHMVWHPSGIINTFGHKDFAGGVVVHMTSGYSALMLAHLVGKREGDKATLHNPVHTPYVLLGTAMLWFGWFGFNGGSAFKADDIAGQALVTTNLCAGTSMVTWLTWSYLRGRKVNAIGACSGLIVGLVVITPGCGYVTVGAAILMGFVGSIVSNVAMHWFKKMDKIDDTLDVFACHGLGGTTGMILTACFASDTFSEDDLSGLFYGSTTLFWHTLVVAVFVILYCLSVTKCIYLLVGVLIPFRVSESDEKDGLDLSFHGEVIGTFTSAASSPKKMAKSNSRLEIGPRVVKVLEAHIIPPSENSFRSSPYYLRKKSVSMVFYGAVEGVGSPPEAFML